MLERGGELLDGGVGGEDELVDLLLAIGVGGEVGERFGDVLSGGGGRGGLGGEAGVFGDCGDVGVDGLVVGEGLVGGELREGVEVVDEDGLVGGDVGGEGGEGGAVVLADVALFGVGDVVDEGVLALAGGGDVGRDGREGEAHAVGELGEAGDVVEVDAAADREEKSGRGEGAASAETEVHAGRPRAGWVNYTPRGHWAT